MRFYRTTDTIHIYPGARMVLDEVQIRDRVQNLIVKPEGQCEVKNPIQFKRGELIGIEKPDKVILKSLELLKPIEEEPAVVSEVVVKVETTEAKSFERKYGKKGGDDDRHKNFV